MPAEQLIAHLRPALADIRGTLANLSGRQRRPVGRLRVLCCRLAAKNGLAAKLGRESVYKWELDKGNKSLKIVVNGSLILDDLDLVIQATLDGAGLAWLSEDRVSEHLESGALVRVLEDWCPRFPGFFLYYPSRRHQPAALAPLIETLNGEHLIDRENRRSHHWSRTDGLIPQ